MFDMSSGHPPTETDRAPLGGQLPQLGDWKSISALVESQKPILYDVVRRARRSPFYAQSSGGDFFSYPMTRKSDLREHSPFGFLAVDRKTIATYHESSGTTGEPTSAYFSDFDWRDIVTRFVRNAVNVDAEDCVLVKTPYSLVTTAHQMHLAARFRGAMVVPADNRSSNIPYSKVIRLLEQIPVTVAWCMPTEVLLWAEAARLAGKDPARAFPKLRSFFVAGEPLTEAKRKCMESIWGGIPVFQDYGSTETGSLAGVCERGRLHLWADRVYCEVWNEAAQTFQASGRGRLVVTPLFRRAMPLIRYCLEDEVEVSHEECDCEWHLPTVQVLGRSESASRVQGQNIFPSDLEEVIYSLSESHRVLFWRARHSESRLEIEFDGAPAAAPELEATIFDRFQIRAEARVAPAPLVSSARLTESAPFSKPRFLFSTHEDWSTGIHY